MNKITVVDAPMGKGKTSWAIKYMNELGKEYFRNRIIYITPYLDEVKRVKESEASSMLEWDILNYLKKWRTNLRATE